MRIARAQHPEQAGAGDDDYGVALIAFTNPMKKFHSAFAGKMQIEHDNLCTVGIHDALRFFRRAGTGEGKSHVGNVIQQILRSAFCSWTISTRIGRGRVTTVDSSSSCGGNLHPFLHRRRNADDESTAAA